MNECPVKILKGGFLMNGGSPKRKSNQRLIGELSADLLLRCGRRHANREGGPMGARDARPRR